MPLTAAAPRRTTLGRRFPAEALTDDEVRRR
jgi:hypothetical protein